jgi:hypothetical protein
MWSSPSMRIGNCGNERVAGPKIGLAWLGTSNVDWWHGHSSRPDWAWKSPTGQPMCEHSFE